MQERLQENSEPFFVQQHNDSMFLFKGNMDGATFDELLIWCHRHGASDVTIQPEMPVMCKIAGKLYNVTKRNIRDHEISLVLTYFYGTSGVSILESGGDLDTAWQTKTDDGNVLRFRINATGGIIRGHNAIQLSIRTLPAAPPLIEQLGLEQEIIDNLRPLNGMILVTGATGSGKSTLLASIIRMLLERPGGNEKILEYSAPIEYIYDSVIKDKSSTIFQTQIPDNLRAPDKSSPFAYAVRNSLRRNPGIILVGESRDRETIKASLEAALTGHLLFTTMHTGGVAETIRRMLLVFQDAERSAIACDILESLHMVVTQTLLPAIQGGRVACREYMVFSPEIKKRLMSTPLNKWSNRIRDFLDEGFGRSLLCSAMSLAQQRLISQETFLKLKLRSE